MESLQAGLIPRITTSTVIYQGAGRLVMKYLTILLILTSLSAWTTYALPVEIPDIYIRGDSDQKGSSKRTSPLPHQIVQRTQTLQPQVDAFNRAGTYSGRNPAQPQPQPAQPRQQQPAPAQAQRRLAPAPGPASQPAPRPGSSSHVFNSDSSRGGYQFQGPRQQQPPAQQPAPRPGTSNHVFSAAGTDPARPYNPRNQVPGTSKFSLNPSQGRKKG